MVCVEKIGGIIRKSIPAQKTKPAQMGIGKMLFFYLLAWGIALPTSLMFLFMLITRVGVEGVFLSNVWLFRWIPLVFVSHFMIIYVVTCSILLLTIIVFRRTHEKLNLSLLEVKTGAVFGGLGFLVTFVILNVVFTTGFIDLFPTTRELSFMGILFPFFLPLTFFEEVWLRNLQLRLPSGSWRKIGIPIVSYLLPRVFPLVFTSFIFGGFILFASALLVIPAFFTAWLFNQSGSILSGAIFNALFSAWIIAVVLPFGGFY